MTDPWAFGWTPLLTIFGFLITAGIAFLGFRSFERWKREKIEEKRLDIAIEAMALAYESKYVFETIRSPLSFAWESQDMPRLPGESDEDARQRAPYFAILSRIEKNRDFFERLFKLQPRFMALFGAEAEQIFMKAHSARRTIEVSASQLMRKVDPPYNPAIQKSRNQWECDIWDGMGEAYLEDIPTANRVPDQIKSFREDVISLCKPFVASKRALLRPNALWKSWPILRRKLPTDPSGLP